MRSIAQSARRGRFVRFAAGMGSRSSGSGSSSSSSSSRAISQALRRSAASSPPSSLYPAPLSAAWNQHQQHPFLHHPRRGVSSDSASSSSRATAKANTPTPAASIAPSVAAEEEEKDKPPPYQDVAFPWRSAPRVHLSFFQRISKGLSDIMPQAFIRGLFFMSVGKLMEAPADDLREVLFRSTRFAFIQAVRGIFEGQCKTPPPSWEYTNDELNPPSSEWELGYPPLSEMMEPKLLEMYQDVVAGFRANNREIRLELESIHPISMHDFRLVIGPSRGTPLPPGATKHTRGGVTVIVPQMPEEGEEEEGGGGRQELGVGNNGQSFMAAVRGSKNHLIFQMAVTFKCKELFYVKNVETEEVVQGEEEVRDTEHVCRFEIDFDNRAQVSEGGREERLGK
jgi:hypothetical protein